ncbi:MAG TPA: outer membrane beta-barrel domain-containing protein [Burkholderiaceae bacterium]|jgi:outer membrane beta-barrel protein|nr:outer membrane beta-barrel domain-containing protein [Burkholderiaceae bacterium]
MRPFRFASFFLLALPAAVLAQAQPPANEQVIQPQVDRRVVKLPKFPSKDFEFGLFAGTYATENFGSSTIYGARLGYHISEDIFVEAAYGRTEVSDENFRQILPGGVFPQPKETLSYYNLSAGYNILPGEVFIGKSIAKASALYLIGGIGSTSFLEQRKQTINFGLGLRVLLKDWAALQVDFRDHVFSLDLLGRRQNTHNLELSAGVTIFF